MFYLKNTCVVTHRPFVFALITKITVSVGIHYLYYTSSKSLIGKPVPLSLTKKTEQLPLSVQDNQKQVGIYIGDKCCIKQTQTVFSLQYLTIIQMK